MSYYKYVFMVIIAPNCHAAICNAESTDPHSAQYFSKRVDSQICVNYGAKQDVPEVTFSTEQPSNQHHSVTSIRVKLLI